MRVKNMSERALVVNRTNTKAEDLGYIDGNKPNQVYKNLERDFVQKFLKDRISKSNVLIRGYSIKAEDKELGIIDE